MPVHLQPPLHTDAPWAPASTPVPAERPQRRLRLAMYLAFLALALAVSLQGAVTWHLETMRSQDAHLLNQAADQRLLALQVGHQATLLLRDPSSRTQATAELGALLRESTQHALSLESNLGHQLDRAPDAEQRLAKALHQ